MPSFTPHFTLVAVDEVDRPVAPLLAWRERLGKALFLRNHVLSIGPAPLRPVLGRHASSEASMMSETMSPREMSDKR